MFPPLLCLALAAAPGPSTSEIPATFTPTNAGFDHQRREVEIPMRDGVKLHTVILVPRNAKRAPILLTRTPYDADSLTSHAESTSLAMNLFGYDNATDVIIEGGYIRVVQDVRGKHGSEGDYVMNRPLRGTWNPSTTDHATDTYDTIEWLIKNVPESNGRVGIIGISYDGFTPLMALVDPHPALKVSVPMNPMVDGWRGDDWFHNGAFRMSGNMPYIYGQEATRKSTRELPRSHLDEYDEFLGPSAGELGKRWGMDQLGFWNRLLEHPAYDAFWKDQAMDRVLAARPLTVPVMVVHGLFDQEDIYGAPAVYRALEAKDAANDKVFLVMGPWCHGQMIRDGSALGPIRFHADTARQFRREILRPFLDQYLVEGAPRAAVAPVTAFETGTSTWKRLDRWPSGCQGGCAPKATPLYLRAGQEASFQAPVKGEAAFDEWVSDPLKPVPYRVRPVRTESELWRTWLVTDQRNVASRTDVMVYATGKLDTPVRLAGTPVVNLVASTSGTDADWVVKLIDVYPDEVPEQPELGGYQLMISADILRGRYRDDPSTPTAIPAGKPVTYRFELPEVNHVVLPGHRLMVQVQSSWFPLYDRNPQTFVPNIFWAKPGDYRKATHRVFHAPGQASSVELPVVTLAP